MYSLIEKQYIHFNNQLSNYLFLTQYLPLFHLWLKLSLPDSIWFNQNSTHPLCIWVGTMSVFKFKKIRYLQLCKDCFFHCHHCCLKCRPTCQYTSFPIMTSRKWSKLEILGVRRIFMIFLMILSGTLTVSSPLV